MKQLSFHQHSFVQRKKSVDAHKSDFSPNFSFPEEKKPSEEELLHVASTLNFDDSSNPAIRVYDPVKKEGLKSYVTYTIKYINNPDLIYRRYSDFFSLREKLVERWPGVYIPNIPPKKALGNLNSKTVELRMRLLNKFCLKLYKFQSSLFNSEEMKIFFSNLSDVKKSLNSLSDQTYADLNQKYMKCLDPENKYKEAVDPTLLSEHKAKINEFNIFLKKALASLINFKEVLYSTLSIKQKEIENYQCLISVFTDYEKYTMLDYLDNDDNKLVFFNPKNSEICMKLLELKEGLDNPYNSMYEWIKEQEIDTEAMIEAITTLHALINAEDQLKRELVAYDDDIKYLKDGGKYLNLRYILSFRAPKDEIARIEHQKKIIQQSLNELSNVIKLAIFNMTSQIETFKMEKLAGYYYTIKLFSETKLKTSSKINGLWRLVRETQTGKTPEYINKLSTTDIKEVNQSEADYFNS